MCSSVDCFYTMPTPVSILLTLLFWNVPAGLGYEEYEHRLPEMMNGLLTIDEDKATAVVECAPGFILLGDPAINYNKLRRWKNPNDTSILPQCLANDTERFKVCHFELREASHCKWFLMTSSDYEWNVFSNYENSILRSRGYEYPYRDRTSSLRKVVMPAHYLLITKKGMKSDRPNPWIQHLTRLNKVTPEAEFISPLFPANAESKEQLCMDFYMYTMGPKQGSLKVRINEEIVWENDEFGKVYRVWQKVTIDLRNQTRNFRISFTGRPEKGEPLGMAIDDVQLLKGDSCEFPQPKQIEPLESTDVKSTDVKSTDVKSTDVESTDDAKNSATVSGFLLYSLSIYLVLVFFLTCIVTVIEYHHQMIIHLPDLVGIPIIGGICMFVLFWN